MARLREDDDYEPSDYEEGGPDRIVVAAAAEMDCGCGGCGLVIEVGDPMTWDDTAGWVLYDSDHFPDED